MENEFICKFCGKVCKNANSHRNHQRLCKMNPDRHYVSHTIGLTAWNKGMTKETNEIVAQIAKTQSEKYSGENSHWFGKHHTEETIKKMRQTSGGYRIGSGRGKHGMYKGFYCDSSWELAFVIYNLEHNIKFERNKRKFNYTFEGQDRTYLPDFIVDGAYVEIKGYWNTQWQAKLDQFPSEEKLIILTKKDMKMYFDYVIDKYGKDFVSLYE